ncbi:MAG TPA: GntR family transcriptional regulator [Gemmatimonadaceae bacterium]|nr:GntR family transcriptional regulator [Gemmatimonadaceae bacterium]
MTKPAAGPLLAPLDAGDFAVVPMYRRLYARIRGAILDGGLAAGHRLPSARTLARDLGVSRNTVEAAFAQLGAEGFLVRRVGSGSYVAPALPDRVVRPRRGAQPRPPGVPPGRRALSARGRAVAGAAVEIRRGVRALGEALGAAEGGRHRAG